MPSHKESDAGQMVPVDPGRLDEFARRLLTSEYVPKDKLELSARVLWREFEAAFPIFPRGQEQEEWYAKALAHAAEKGVLRLPADKKSWDYTVDPPQPRKAWRILPKAIPSPTPWKQLLWRDELRWIYDVTRMSDSDFEFLKRVQEGLRQGWFLEPAPMRNLSVRLTGLEKRLEDLAKGALFGDGRLTLELLNCAPQYPPLTTFSICQKPTILIFENNEVFHTAIQVMDSSSDPPYGNVGFGHGAEFVQSVKYLRRVLPNLETIAYVGDIDRYGLNIARRADETAQAAGLPAVIPAPGFYEKLCAVSARTHSQGFPPSHKEPDEEKRVRSLKVPDEDLVQWLPTQVRSQVLAIFAAGNRIAEELLGPQELREIWGLPKRVPSA